MADDFKPGELVQLKSGGPIMTVDWVGEDAMTHYPSVACVWIEGNKKYGEKFSPHILEHYKPPSSVRVGRIR